MNLENLEWDRFTELAAEQAATEPARERLRALARPDAWAPNLDAARELQAETAEALTLLEKTALWASLRELGDPFAPLDRLNKGGVLEVAELTRLLAWLTAVDQWQQTPPADIKAERFAKALRALPNVAIALRTVSRVITPDGEVSERASPKLTALTQELRRLRQSIQSSLDEVMRGFAKKGVLQDSYSDVRDGRYVVPVRMGAQGEVEGVFHEASASKQTVFVEPKEIAPLNNQLRQKQNEIHEEIYRILVATSAELRPQARSVADACETLVRWDAIQAKARMGRIYRGVPIDVAPALDWRLAGAAHPLLSWALQDEQIIRNKLEVAPPTQALLFSGPNTGGKTVFLKMLGVAAACARTGFLFPGSERCVVPFFKAIQSDLGDPQSISEHLSTFSGHLMRLRTILAEAGPQTLVLLDELNSSTDPEEGFALSRAVLDELLQKGAWVVATTHDPKLKALGLEDTRVMNASVQFDEGSRSPTYRLVLGAPGRSRALDTAERLGLPATVLAKARSFMSTAHRAFEHTLARLEADLAEAASARTEAVRARDEATRLEREWRERTEASLQETLARTRMRLRRVLESTQEELRALIVKAQEGGSAKDLEALRSQSQAQFDTATQRLDQAFSEEAPDLAALVATKPARGGDLSGLSVGDSVRVPRWKSVGTILEISGDKIKVALGSVQFQLKRDEIVPLEGASARPKAPRVHAASSAPEEEERLDLRGDRFEEAMAQLQAYLDRVYRGSSRVAVTIVHGVGTGALREGTRALLAKLPYIKSFRDGGMGGGGAGATIVEFER